MVLHEPYFVARPGSRKEDDGVLLVRALDLQENKGLISTGIFTYNFFNFSVRKSQLV